MTTAELTAEVAEVAKMLVRAQTLLRLGVDTKGELSILNEALEVAATRLTQLRGMTGDVRDFAFRATEGVD